MRAYALGTGEVLWDDRFDKDGRNDCVVAVAGRGDRVFVVGRSRSDTGCFFTGGAADLIVRAYDLH